MHPAGRATSRAPRRTPATTAYILIGPQGGSYLQTPPYYHEPNVREASRSKPITGPQKAQMCQRHEGRHLSTGTEDPVADKWR